MGWHGGISAAGRTSSFEPLLRSRGRTGFGTPLDGPGAGRQHVRMRSQLRSLLVPAVALATLAFAAPLRAQLLPGPGLGSRPRIGGPVIAARVGWSTRDNAPSVGASMTLALPIPIIRPSIDVGGDFVFHSGLTELQGVADVTSGFLRPIYLGGGPAVLNSVFEGSTARQTKAGFTVVAGLRGGFAGPLQTDLSFRLVRVGELHPRYFMLAFGYPLFGLFGKL
jgi:hypothetical protein